LPRRTEVAPLVPVDRAQIARLSAEARALFRRRPLVPDRHALLVERGILRITSDEPKQLVNDRAQMQLLGRQSRKAFAERKAHLVPEDALCPDTRPVGTLAAVLKSSSQQIEVGLHATSWVRSREA
jgi:hypothetical protein